MTLAAPPFRADHVGSLLRPARLRDAFRLHRAGTLSDDEFGAVQDTAIRDVVAMQEQAGLQSITDGEFRRSSYWAHFVEAVDGLAVAPALFEFIDAEGDHAARRGGAGHAVRPASARGGAAPRGGPRATRGHLRRHAQRRSGRPARRDGRVGALEPVADGERGISVVTNLLSEASPQLRFVVGDYTRLTRGRCACGRTSTRALGGFAGRADDMLNIRGVTLFPSVIDNAVRGVPDAGAEYEVVINRPRGLDELTVRVEAVPGLAVDGHDALRSAVSTAIRSTAELRAEVEILEHGTLPRTQLKARRIRDER